MTYRCASCNRRLLTPAFVGIGGWMLGPKCAKAAGKTAPRKGRERVVTVVRIEQIELFDLAEISASNQGFSLTR